MIELKYGQSRSGCLSACGVVIPKRLQAAKSLLIDCVATCVSRHLLRKYTGKFFSHVTSTLTVGEDRFSPPPPPPQSTYISPLPPSVTDLTCLEFLQQLLPLSADST